MTKTKKILNVLLAICMLATLSISAFAVSNSDASSKYRVTSTISGKNATFLVSSLNNNLTYPIGSGTARYKSAGGSNMEVKSVRGTSYSAYWVAYYTFPSGSSSLYISTTSPDGLTVSVTA